MIYLRIKCGCCKVHSEEGFEIQRVKESRGTLSRVGEPQYLCADCWRKAVACLANGRKHELD